MSAGGQLVSRLQAAGSEHFIAPVGKKSPQVLWQVFALRRFLRQQKVDVLHVRSRLPAWVAWQALKGLSVAQRPAFVTTVHGFYSVKRYSAIMTQGQRVIAVSDSTREYLADNYAALDMSRVRVIERGIDQTQYPFQYRPAAIWQQHWYKEYPFLFDRKVLLLPGRITRLKGHLDFVDLMARLIARDAHVFGLIVGGKADGREAYWREIQARITDLKLDQYVAFTGARLDLRNIMAASDMVLSLSSQPESFGRTVQEALSLGVPVVAYDHGGVAESLARAFPPGGVEPGNMDQLEERVYSLLQTPEPVARYTFQSIDAMVDDTLAVYRELLD